MQKDIVLRGLLADGSAQFYAVSARDLVAEAKAVHDCSATCTAALGRSLMATIMMQTMEKGEGDEVSVLINGDGPAGNIVCVGRFGEHGPLVKGYIQHPQTELPARADGKLDVGGAVGHNGTLTVIRDQGFKEPYIGKSDLVSGEIAEDIGNYFAFSQQQPSVVYLGVHIGKDFQVKSAAGLIVQLLPGCGEKIIDRLEACTQNFPALAGRMEEDVTLAAVLEDILTELSPEVLEERKIAFACDCSRERVERALIAIGQQELTDMIEEDGQAELTCHFCNKVYTFTKEDLEVLLEQAIG